MSLRPSAVARYYLGDPTAYLNPRSYTGLLEVTHFHLFAMGMLLLVLTHLMLFVPLRSGGTKAALIAVPFAAALLDEGAGWLVRYGGAAFAPLKVAGFLLLQGSLATLVALSLWAVFRGSPQPAEDATQEPAEPAQSPAGATAADRGAPHATRPTR